MITFECKMDKMSFKGYYSDELDSLCFYNCKGDDIGSRLPINPFNRVKQHYKHKNFEEIYDWIMTHYNLLKIAVKENSEKINFEVEYKNMKVIINKVDKNES